MEIELSELKADNPAVLKTIELHQELISKCSGWSASCKNQCLVIVVPIFITLVIKDLTQHTILLLIPIMVLYLLDSYYLSIEKNLRNSLNVLSTKIENNQFKHSDLFKIQRSQALGITISQAMFSIITFPFYFGIIPMALIGLFLPSS